MPGLAESAGEAAVRRPLEVVRALHAAAPGDEGDAGVRAHFQALLDAGVEVRAARAPRIPRSRAPPRSPAPAALITPITRELAAYSLCRARLSLLQLAYSPPRASRSPADPTRRRQVPLLTPAALDALPNASLVRFRGMVQDLPDPEYYAAEYLDTSSGQVCSARYADALPPGAAAPGPGCRLAERRPALLVLVPGEPSWARAARAGAAGAPAVAIAAGGGAGGAKRGRAAAAAAPAPSASMPDAGPAAPPADDGDSAAAARARTDRAARAAAEEEAMVDVDAGAGEELLETGRSSGGADEEEPLEPEPPLPAGAVQAFFYDGEEDLKLCEVVEVVGVLSRAPELAAAGGFGADAAAAADAPPPTSLAPRLHALLVRREASPYPARYCGTASTADADGKGADASAAAAAAAELAALVAAGRPAALARLRAALGGDALAAEYCLLQLVSRVRARTPDGAPIGALPLNLTGAPLAAEAAAEAPAPTPEAAAAAAAGALPPPAGLSPLGAALGAALADLAPRTAALPLGRAALGARRWAPRRAPGGRRLAPAPLQLAPGTQVLLDETVMAAGALDARALANLGALAALAGRQRVPYDFGFFALEQPADAPVTILSAGPTLLKGAGALALPLRLADEDGAAAAESDADLGAARRFLAAARALEFSIPEGVAARVEADLAAARRVGAGAASGGGSNGAAGAPGAPDARATQETFHQWLTVARALAASHGEAALGAGRWAAARALETARAARCAAPRGA
jgi:hypothetical protein